MVVLKTAAIFVCLCIALTPAAADTAATPHKVLNGNPHILAGLDRIYNFDFEGGHRVLGAYQNSHPDDPLGHAMRAATYLFSELDRMGVLEAEFFKDDSRIKKEKPVKDLVVRDKLFALAEKAEAMSRAQLVANPENANAMFALCVVNGIRLDYYALVDKKFMRTVPMLKESSRYASRLHQLEPGFHDAQLTLGFNEYIVGSLPFFLRWLVKLEGVEGEKEIAFRKLELVSKEGVYFRPFAKLLLAMVNLREKRPEDAQRILSELVVEFPENQMMKRELKKLNQDLAAKAGKTRVAE